MGFDAIVFDLDGTLIDSVPDVRGAVNRMLVAEGRSPISLEQAHAFVGEGARVLVEKALAATGPLPEIIDDHIERYIDFYKKHPADETVVYPGVVEALETLAGRGVRMGICTNKPFVMTGLVLEALGLDRYFSAITGGDNVPHRKPDGRHVLLTLEMMKVAAAGAAMVGDSETDVAAGKDAGLPVVAVTYGYAHVPVAEMGADAVIDCFSALPDTLDSLYRPGH
jgi:phosphoglycolate phosphatase